MAVLYPLSSKVIHDFVKGLKAVVVPEVNYDGQFARHLRAQMGLETLSFTKYSGLPFSPAEIAGHVREVIKDLKVRPTTEIAEEAEA